MFTSESLRIKQEQSPALTQPRPTLPDTAMEFCTLETKCWNCNHPANRQKCQGPGGTEEQSKQRSRIQRAQRVQDKRQAAQDLNLATASAPERPDTQAQRARLAENQKGTAADPNQETEAASARPETPMMGDQETRRAALETPWTDPAESPTSIPTETPDPEEKDSMPGQVRDSDLPDRGTKTNRERKGEKRSRQDTRDLPNPGGKASSSKDTDNQRGGSRQDTRDLPNPGGNASSSKDTDNQRGERMEKRQDGKKTEALQDAISALEDSSDESITGGLQPVTRPDCDIFTLSQRLDGPRGTFSRFGDLGVLLNHELLKGIYYLEDFRIKPRAQSIKRSQTTWMWAQNIINQGNEAKWMDNLLLASVLDQIFQMSNDPLNRGDLFPDHPEIRSCPGLADIDNVLDRSMQDLTDLLQAKQNIDNGLSDSDYWSEAIAWNECKGKLNLVRSKLCSNAMNLVARKTGKKNMDLGQHRAGMADFCSNWWHLWSNRYHEPMLNAVRRPFLSAKPSTRNLRSCTDLAAQLLLAEFLSPDFEGTSRPWRQRWSVPCDKCFQLTPQYQDSRQVPRCQECINIFENRDTREGRPIRDSDLTGMNRGP